MKMRKLKKARMIMKRRKLKKTRMMMKKQRMMMKRVKKLHKVRLGLDVLPYKALMKLQHKKAKKLQVAQKLQHKKVKKLQHKKLRLHRH